MVAPRTLESAARPSRLRRWILGSLALVGVAASCAPGFDPPSKVTGLRVLGVEADLPYANPGDTVTLRMTVTDGLGDAEGKPRPLQIVWIGGCVDPPGDQYFLCLPELAKSLASLGGGASGLVKLEATSPESDGEPSAHEFSVTLPGDIVSRRPPPESGPHYGIAYVFFAACAGTLAPASFEQKGAVPEFPLQCLDADGNPQGPESFVPGYTQIYAFADGRTNDNPPTTGLVLAGQELPEDPAAAPTVARCGLSLDDRRQTGCAKEELRAQCEELDLTATIDDVAEALPGASSELGTATRETVWVSYFAAAGDLSTNIKLVSDSSKGYLPEHGTKWLPPAEPGLVSLWAVTRDQRGGQSVRRGWVRVE